MKERGVIVTTLVPEQYKPTAVEAKSHNILGRPLYIASNANGDILWIGMYIFIIAITFHCVNFFYIAVIEGKMPV